MSTIKTTYIQHPSATSPNIELAADGTVVLPLSDLEDLANVSGTPSAGDSLVYDGSEWQPYVPSENVVINGAMQVHQRGTSVTGINNTNASYNCVDRWRMGILGSGEFTLSAESDAPAGTGLSKSAKYLVTTANAAPSAGDSISVQHRMEGQNVQVFKKGSSFAEPFALSFWVKSNVTGTYVATLYDDDNTRQVGAQYSISSSGTWEKKTIIFPADTTGALDNDSALSLRVFFWLSAGSDRTSGTLQTDWAASVTADLAVGQTNVAAATNNYWQVTGVQLEAGSVATPFQFEDYGTTLAKCQRYYWKVEAGTYTNHGLGIGTGTGGTNPGIRRLMTPLPVFMRARPTVTIGGTHALFDGALTDIVLASAAGNWSSPNNISIDVNTTSTGVTHRPYMWILNSSSSADYLEASAEL